jgi:pilus assembly protein Flp/PilA
MFKAFINDESGATAIEYGLIAGLVAVAIIAALTALGSSLDTLFSQVATTVSGATS